MSNLIFPSAPVSERRTGNHRSIADAAAKLCDEKAARFYPARIRDVSAGGCRLIVPPSFAPKPGAELYLHVADGSSGVGKRTEMRPVRIAWRMPLDDFGGFAIGVERIDVMPQQISLTSLAA